MSDEQFSRSMYANAEDLYKAKAEYYKQKYETCRTEYEQKVIEAAAEYCDKNMDGFEKHNHAFGIIEAIKQVMKDDSIDR